MYIVDNRTKTNATFGELIEGDCFVATDYNNEEVFCMKVCLYDDCSDPFYCAVVLETGAELITNEDTSISKDTPVTKVNAKVTFW
jgi:hypothetical protein